MSTKALVRALSLSLGTMIAAPTAAATFTYTPLEWFYPGDTEPRTDYSIHVELSPRATVESIAFFREDEWFIEDAEGNINDYGWSFWCNVDSLGAKACDDTYPHSDAPLVDVVSGSRGIRILVKQARIAPLWPEGTYISGPEQYYGYVRIVASGDDADHPLVGAATFRGLRDYVPVPEPETWSLMIAGFGTAGAALRRRRASLG